MNPQHIETENKMADILQLIFLNQFSYENYYTSIHWADFLKASLPITQQV